MNQERLVKIIEDLQECISDIDECLEILQSDCDNELMIKLSKSSLRQLFVSYHTIIEEFASIMLKEIKKYKIGMSLNDSLAVLKERRVIDKEMFDFLEKSRLLRNRISHRYKEPDHEELMDHILKYESSFKKIIRIAKKHLRD